jgi:hypothetical protein
MMALILAQYFTKSGITSQKGRDGVGVEDYRYSSGLIRSSSSATTASADSTSSGRA